MNSVPSAHIDDIIGNGERTGGCTEIPSRHNNAGCPDTYDGVVSDGAITRVAIVVNPVTDNVENYVVLNDGP